MNTSVTDQNTNEQNMLDVFDKYFSIITATEMANKGIKECINE